MKKTRFTKHQVLQVLKELEDGISAINLSRKLGVSNATIYNWHAKYGSMTKSKLKRLRKSWKIKIIGLSACMRR